ncbi:MAG: TIGR04551 family protein [Bradymonadales bacterium]|nr:TIGR04551 family protein [Bradymonadales bacterium]
MKPILQSWPLAFSLLALLWPLAGHATGFTEFGQDIEGRSETTLELGGFFRIRGEDLYNLDLDRGPTPSGDLLFPVPLADPTAQSLTHADMRLRMDLSAYVPAAGLAVKLRLDLLDNLELGSLPEGPPAGTTTQQPPLAGVTIRRAYGEMLLPFGLLAAGRMGCHWGLGMLTNGGDCADCDSGDAGDRIALITPLIGHLWAVAYDFSATGPSARRQNPARTLDLEPTDDVRTLTFALLRHYNDLAILRRLRAHRPSFEYGAYVSHRWQTNDIPASYLPLATSAQIGPTQVMARGFTATAFDAWLRLTLPSLRIEAEGALMLARFDQPSLIPGVLLHEPVSGTQYGLAVESEIGEPQAAFSFGIDLGMASGDPTPGFGAFPDETGAAPRPGDLDGPQAAPPHDNRIDNFRFHPDYRVDRILFREIVGTVTDAFYLRPHLRWRVARFGPGDLELAVAAVASWAVQSASTPGGDNPLGVEIDPTLLFRYSSFSAALEHAVLFPLSGLDNPTAELPAKPAQLLRVRLVYGF